ncbi:MULTISPECIES: hypothetical protein [Streptomyces]|uniref:hypothetical protein n=1 Tax=Streptomyces TaxID=1883 RepID=UPI000E69DB8F|nr:MULTISPECIES: hypothetical protein [Streptomyces]MDX3065797.1 hypothetical protein [Streptomyces sp. ND04-05B]MDX3519671.1 hypothetical protein [Streptomyces scabiei]
MAPADLSNIPAPDPANYDAFRQCMDSIVHTGNSASLADLVRRAAALFTRLDGHPAVPAAPEALAATLTAASTTTHLPTLTALAWRAGQLWTEPASVDDDRRAGFVGCLPEFAHHPAVTAASSALRRAGIPLAVFLHDWRNLYGEHGAQGMYLSPNGERTVEASWFIDGRDNEGALRRPRVVRVREARNAALERVRVALSSAGWNTYSKTSTNTQTRRDLGILASLPL